MSLSGIDMIFVPQNLTLLSQNESAHPEMTAAPSFGVGRSTQHHVPPREPGNGQTWARAAPAWVRASRSDGGGQTETPTEHLN